MGETFGRINSHRKIALSIVASLAAAAARVAAADAARWTAPLVVAVGRARTTGAARRAVAAAVTEAKVGAVGETVPLQVFGLLWPAEADLGRAAIEGWLRSEAFEEAIRKAVDRCNVVSSSMGWVMERAEVTQGKSRQASYCNWHRVGCGRCIVGWIDT